MSMTKGDTAEEAVGWRNNTAFANQEAKIDQIGTEGKLVTGRDGKLVMVAKKSSVDFRGTKFGGLSVLFDTKECATDRYKHDPESIHQLWSLWDHYTMGAAAFLLVMRSPEEWYIIWPTPDWEEPCSSWVCKLSERGVPVPCEGGYGLPDYLSVVSDAFDGEIEESQD